MQRYLFPGFDHQSAIEARDRALGQVAENSGPWIGEALRHVRLLPLFWEGTGEDIRLELARRGCPAPHHHNAWGSLIRIAIEHDLLKEVGMGQMKTLKSHARRTPVWRRVLGERNEADVPKS